MDGRPAGDADPPTAGAGTLSLRGRAEPPDRPADPPSTRLRRRPRSPGRRRELLLVAAVVAAGALAGALLTDVEPSGNAVADRLFAAAAVAVVAGAASTARRWTWLVLAAVALATAGDTWAVGCAFAALALALLTAGPIRPHPAVGALVGALGAFALLRIGDLGPLGLPVLVSGLAVAPVLVSGHQHAGRRTRRRVRRAALACGAAVVLVGLAYGLALRSARPAAERGLAELDAGLAAAHEGDDAAAAGHLDAAADAFADADGHLGGWMAAPARVLPVMGHNARATATMAAAAADVARQGAASATEADTDTLTVQGGRLDLARVRALGAPLDAVAVTLAGAAEQLDDVRSPWLVTPVAQRLERVRTEVADARPDVDLAADAVHVLPAMFGGDGPSRWFVAFVTPVEARGRTGFMGNYAELTITDGQVEMTEFGRASDLEAGGTPGPQRTLSGPDDYLARYARFAPAATWRNVTMSPDFPSVGQVMAELYPQSGGRPVDGVIAVDPAGLAALLTLTGPVDVPGIEQTLTPDNAADFLLRQQYLQIEDTASRIDALEGLARATFDHLTTGDLPGPRAVADSLGAAVAAGHLHAYATDAEQQHLFEDVGLDGALPAVDGGDSLAVVSNNAIGNKVDLFLRREVAYDATWDPDTGEVAATATITLTNAAPSSGLPDSVIGTSLGAPVAPPTGTDRTYLSVYSPWELDAATLDGAPVEIERQPERGRYAYSLFLDVPPEGGVRTLVLDLDGRVDAGARYQLDVATQPLATPDEVEVSVTVEGADSGDVTASAPLEVEGATAHVTGPVTDERTRAVVRSGS